MTISEDDVRRVFEVLFSRSPENDSVRQNSAQARDIDELVHKVVFSPEFQKRFLSQLYTGMTDELVPLLTERVVFLHIPKSGGTTLHRILGEWFGVENLHPERHNGLYYYSAADLASRLVFSGHYDYYSTNLIPGPSKKISFLRNPIERLISLYNFHRAHKPEFLKRNNLKLPSLANEYLIDEYFARPEIRSHPAINNTMARYFSDEPQILFRWEGGHDGTQSDIEKLLDQALQNIEKFDFIGFMENYEESIVKLSRVLGRQAPSPIAKEQVLDVLMDSNSGMRRIEIQRPNDRTLAGLEELVAYDRLVYAKAEKLFRHQA